MFLHLTLPGLPTLKGLSSPNNPDRVRRSCQHLYVKYFAPTGNVIKLSILNLNVFTAEFAEKAQRATEFLFGELLCETLHKPLRLSAVIFVTFSVNLTALPDGAFILLHRFFLQRGRRYSTFISSSAAASL